MDLDTVPIPPAPNQIACQFKRFLDIAHLLAARIFGVT